MGALTAMGGNPNTPPPTPATRTTARSYVTADGATNNPGQIPNTPAPFDPSLVDYPTPTYAPGNTPFDVINGYAQNGYNAGQLAQYSSFLQQMNAPAYAAFNATDNGLNSQLAAQAAAYKDGGKYAWMQAANSLGQIGIQRAGNDDQYGIVDRQGNLVNATQGIQDWRRQVAQQYFGTQRGFAGTGYDIGIGGADLALARGNAQLDDAKEAAISDSVARGATSFGGLGGQGGQLSDITRDRGFLGTERDLTGRDLALSRDKALAGITNQEQNMLLDDADKRLGYNEQRALLGDRKRELDRIGQSLGLKGEEVGIQLGKALSALNLQSSTSLAQLMTGLASNNAQRAQLTMGIVEQLLAYQRGQG